VILLAALAVLMQNLAEPGVVWLRADNHAVPFVVLSVASLIVNLVGTIIFVGFLRMGIAGALLAVALSNSIPVIVTFPLILVRAGLSVSIDIYRNLLTFGLPSIPTLIFVWVLQLADRYLLSFYESLAQTASYSVAYLLGGALGPVVIGPFLLAWSGSMYTIAKRDNATHVFRLVFRWYSLLLLLSTFAFSLVATFVLTLLFPPAYHTAGPVIPVIAMSIMFYGIYNVFIVGVSVRRKMWLPTIFTAASALLNISLNIILIPLDGMMGAAFATIIAYAFLACISYIANQRIYPVPFEIGMFLIATMIGVFLYVGSVFLAHGQAAPDNWGIQVGAVGLYAMILLALGLLTGQAHKTKRKQEVSTL
jgi:O-antigen/teichoic acid export membrane protein